MSIVSPFKVGPIRAVSSALCKEISPTPRTMPNRKHPVITFITSEPTCLTPDTPNINLPLKTNFRTKYDNFNVEIVRNNEVNSPFSHQTNTMLCAEKTKMKDE